MKTNHINGKDNFNSQINQFKGLLAGSRMAKLSSMVMALSSIIVLVLYSSGDRLAIVSLLFGAVVNVFYTLKFLSLKKMKKKSYTQNSLGSSISKFRAYINNRKKYEYITTSIWILSLIPSLSQNFDSYLNASIFSIILCVIVCFLGAKSFKKVEKIISGIESSIQVDSVSLT